MASQNPLTKIILAGLLITALTTVTVAANIDTAGDNNIVWQNSNVENQLTVQCEPDEGNLTSVNISGNELEASGSETGFSSDELSKDNISWDGSEYEVVANCSNVSESTSQDVIFDSASFKVNKHGAALVGERLEEGENSDSLELEVSTESSDASSEDIRSSSFSFDNYLSFEGGSASGDQISVYENYEVTLNPKVESYTSEPLSLSFKGAEALAGLERKIEIDPDIYKWRWNEVKGPDPEISYEEVSDEYIYHLNMERLEGDGSRVADDRFLISVRDKKKEWDEGFEEMNSPYDELVVLNSGLSDENGANYRIAVDDPSKLDSLPPGTYQFDLRFRYPGLDDQTLLVDRTLVEKYSDFSGQVLDSGGNGIETSMFLDSVDSTSSHEIETGPDGLFSTDINEDKFDINVSFGPQPRSRVSMSNVDLSSSTGPNSGLSSVGFEYWKDPQARIKGLRPVNMMAIKFGYPTENVKSLDMTFDSGELDPKDMRVYECNEWNFQGSECMGAWTEVPENDISIDYASWRVSVDNANLYDTDSGDILMNAYMVGTSSKISLQDSISLESSKIKHNGELKASGVLVSDTGERVSDANVTLSLVQGDEVVESWTESSDSTGTFEFSEKAGVEAGNYQLRLEASKSPYESFEMTSEDTLNVYYEKGLALSAPTSKEVVQGNKSSVSVEVSNTGQQKVENIEVDVSGLERGFYSVSSNIENLEAEETKDFEIGVDLPDDYCSLPCGSPPELDISVTGEAGDEEVSDSLMTSIVLTGEPEQSSDSGTETENKTSTENTDNSSSSSSPVESVKEMTGDFVEKQDDLNIALGLIFIFTMMLALSVRKKNSGGRDTRDDRGRPQIQKPPVSSSQVQDVEAKKPETEDEDGSENPEEEDEPEESGGDSYECSVCGEEFESESGRDLHEEAVH